ncbi:MAG: Abi family protein [Acutalibacteraceae bacterium]
MKPKSINSLMVYMRDVKNIQISGSTQKQKLRYMGYYHGYKGYRYYNLPSNKLTYTDFNELQAVYDFDMDIKSILYPQIMFIETTLKNYVLESILDKAKSERFADIYSQLLNDYKSYTLKSGDYKKSIIKRMNLRNKIYSVISRDYGHNNIISHYYDKDCPVPIWAIFELLSLGEFGNFVSCLNLSVRKDVSKVVGVKSSFDSDGRMIEKIVYALKDLRNAVAHNNTVFDTRFKSGSIDKRIASYITAETHIKNIDFNTIVDYIILIVFIMKLLKSNKTDILLFINQFETACEKLKKLIPINMYFKIVGSNTREKLLLLRNFV